MPPTSKKTSPAEALVKYPKVVVGLAGIEIPPSDQTVTLTLAQDLLGYSELDEKDSGDYLMQFDDGVKIRADNNSKNRPLDEAHVRKLAQDLLNGHWRFNGETIVIGDRGQVLSGQHRLLALILAVRLWKADAHYREVWPEEPVLRSLVVYGVSEDKEVTRTLDNVKTRTLADVIFSDNELFAKSSTSERKLLAATVEYSLKQVWHRTGRKADAYAPIRTHSEALEFVEAHPKLLRMVKHIVEEDSGEEGFIKKLVPRGTAAGLGYLMAASNSDPKDYDGTEKSLDMSNWDKAADFWVKFAQGIEKGFKLLRTAIRDMSSMDGDGKAPSFIRDAMIVKAWLCFSSGKELTKTNLGYEYAEFFTADKSSKYTRMIQCGLEYYPKTPPNNDVNEWLANRELIEVMPSVGGIDLGDPEEAQREKREAEKEAAKLEKERQKALAKEQLEKEQKSKEINEVLSTIRKDHPEKLLVWEQSGEGAGSYKIWGSDAIRAEKILGRNPEESEKVAGMTRITIKKEEVSGAFAAFKKAKIPVGVCGWQGEEKGYGYLGLYTPGGYIPESESSDPATPLPPVASKKPIPKTPTESKAEPAKKTTPASKGKVLKGGIK